MNTPGSVDRGAGGPGGAKWAPEGPPCYPGAHTVEDTRDWIDEVFWARMYAGIHFYKSLEDGRQLGTTVARAMLRSHFGLQHASLDLTSEKHSNK